VDLSYTKFCDTDLNDPFFDSLKGDYAEFPNWFQKKALSQEMAYVFKNESGKIDGFLYLKVEDGAVMDVAPPLPPKRRLKIGTFKINAHGTRMGERFIKKAFDHAIYEQIDELYVTIFAHHDYLVKAFQKYGFVAVANKDTVNGTELVLIKTLGNMCGDVLADYPYINANNRKFILSLYPKWHSRLLPDSILKNEDPVNIVNDISHTNSIHKIYLSKMDGTESLQRGDILVIYRTSDQQGPAYYRSVATSICVVEEVRDLSSFLNEREFLTHSNSYSIFSEQELVSFYSRRNYPTVIRFTYNIALPKRVTNGQMKDELGISPRYWGFFRLTDGQFAGIAEKGNINESLIIN